MPTAHTTTPRRPLLTEKQVAEFLSVTIKVTQKWRAHRVGPKWFRVGPSMVRYCPDDLDSYLDGRQSLPDERRI